jgi:hypothetical protein
MMNAIEVVTPDRLNTDNSVKLFAEDGLVTYYNQQPDGSFKDKRPCASGDVLSVQPDGILEGRDKVYGIYELPTVTTKGLLYRSGARSWLIPYAD